MHARVYSLLSALALCATASPVFAQADHCADAGPLPIGVVQGTAAGADLDGASACGLSRTADVWYRFTAPFTGVLVFNGCSTALGTGISVHTDCPGTVNNLVGCAYSDSYTCNPHLEVNLTGGQTYYVRMVNNGIAFQTSTYFFPPKPPVSVGPDIVTGDIPETAAYGTSNGFAAYAYGTSACNVGDSYAIWTNVNNSNQHPVISSSMYRLKAGRLEQIGVAWLKHGWASGTETWCDYCPMTGAWDRLFPGCTDSYDVPQNGTQSTLGPRSPVNPTTGVFPYPPTPPGDVTDRTSRRIRVPTAAVDPAQNAGARYFAEVHYVAADDALFNNALNNASYREITIQSVGSAPRLVGMTQRTRPAILAWADNDPEVVATPLDFADGTYTCRVWVAAKAHDNGDGSWTYTYNIFNLNANRSVSSFTMPRFANVPVTLPGFAAPLAHSGEAYSNTPWAFSGNSDSMGWRSAQTYEQNPNANAIRWGTMYTMWLTSMRPPAQSIARLGLFMPGQPGEPEELGVTVPVPSTPCTADFNADGFVDFLDFSAFIGCFDGVECPPGRTADVNSDGFVDFFDFNAFADAFTAGC